MHLIRSQIGWGTADNATNNDTALKAFGKEIDPQKLRWDPIEQRVRCGLINIFRDTPQLNFSGAWSMQYI
jgi:hypothetical protein